ncbi:MAG: LuxR C-terminal-related transcriptional regulator [Pseudomonadota bacterium]
MQNPNWLTDTHTKIAAASDQLALTRVVEDVVADWGFDQFHFASFYVSPSGGVGEGIEVSNMASELLDYCNEADVNQYCPYYAHASRSTAPVFWRDVMSDVSVGKVAGQSADFAQMLATDWQLNNGVTIQTSRSGCLISGIGLIAHQRTDPRHVTQMYDTHVAEIAALEAMLQNYLANTTAFAEVYELSPREQAVLAWLSEGLSVKEIVHRSGRSESTIEKQIASARNRMRSKTTVQAVVKAASAGLLN